MFRILQQRRLVDHHEIDIFSCGSLCVSSGGLILSARTGVIRAVFQVNGGIKPGLRDLDDARKAVQYRLGFGGVYIEHQIIQSRCDEQIAVICRYFILIHLVLRGDQRG